MKELKVDRSEHWFQVRVKFLLEETSMAGNDVRPEQPAHAYDMLVTLLVTIDGNVPVRP
jgi:hypothetical protein